MPALPEQTRCIVLVQNELVPGSVCSGRFAVRANLVAFEHPEPKPSSHRLIMGDGSVFRQTLLAS